ncbi:MAG: 50S ribosome-binding GTPase [Anaerotruncus sp.]|nr:MAG: 50S ribosome-binding GTPase [Anaerotruncus sp.]
MWAKSSLLNKLFNRKNLARVSSVPGKTVTVNFFIMLTVIASLIYRVTATLKISKSEKDRFAELMEGYFQSGRNIKLVVQLVDMRHKPSADDIGMISFLNEFELPYIIVLTKADKLKKKEYAARLAAMPEELGNPAVPIIPFSAQSGLGVDEVKKMIEKSFNSQEDNE